MNIRTELILWSEEFPIDEVYNEIGLSGNKDVFEATERKTISGGVFIQPRECSITYSCECADTIRVSDSLDVMYEMVESRIQIIEEIIRKSNLCAKFCVTLNITDEPEIIIPVRFLHLATRFGATIEFDTYVDIDKTIEYDENSGIE